MSLQIEYDFTLPKGYVDKDGNLHREGTMRLANAKDEIAPLADPRVQRNQAYLIVILLSRVITRLDGVKDINPSVIENLFTQDLRYLQDFYNRINGNEAMDVLKENDFDGATQSLGEFQATL
jgi:hypothetical protein